MNLIKIENTINIRGNDLQVVEYKGVRVLSSYDIARLHGKEVKAVNQQFERNKGRLEEGIDYFLIDREELLKSQTVTLPPNLREIKLFTERGYLKLVKSFTDDLSWEVQDLLVDSYFALQQTLKPMSEMEMIHVMSGEVIKIQNRLEQVEQKVEELSDISEFYDRLMSDKGLYTSTQMGSLFNLSAKAFNNKLKEHKIAYKTTQEGRTYMVFYSQYKDSNLGQVVLWNRRNGSFGSCLKFRLNIIPLLEKKFDMKANPDVLKQFLYQRIKDAKTDTLRKNH